MNQCVWIDGPIIGINEIIAGQSRMGPRGHNPYNTTKKKLMHEIHFAIMLQGFKKMDNAFFTFVHYESSKRRDPDNFAGGAQKVILDALVEGGFIRNDGWKENKGLKHYWDVDKRSPGIAVIMTSPESEPNRRQAMLMAKETKERESGRREKT